MLKGKDIICISSIDWDFIWQGHQEIMSTLAENGNRVLFIENTGVRPPGIKDISRIKSRLRNWLSGIKGIRKVRDNLFVYSPLVLPFPYLKVAVKLNSWNIISILEKWLKAVRFNDPVIWTFLPTPLTLDLIDKLPHKLSVYYCIDSFASSSANARKIKDSEMKLLKISDLVFTTSKELYDYCRNYNQNVHMFPFGVNYAKFEKIRLSNNPSLQEIRSIEKPIIGYVGGIHKWIDLDLLNSMATERPEYSFVFVGPVQTNIHSLPNRKNIYFLGKQFHDKLPSFIKDFDVCIIPYKITEYTNNVYPTKLNEYLAMGKPVISTPLPEIINFNKENNNIIKVGDSYSNFISLIDKAITETGDANVKKRIEAARNNSWDNRILEMSKLIENIDYLKSSADFNWQESFVKLFKKMKGKVLQAAIATGLLYGIIFYTPLVWILAEPLRVSQDPHKADAIVVFAGGVGESGKAGQGYEERIYHAAELYRQGYADKLIFSSGYSYFLEEALVMKAVAVSLKVPEASIILEDKAKSTYENIKFTKEILDNKKIDSILLVSSPYHMRRALLVFNKVARDIKVTCVPVPNSVFYVQPQKGWKKIKPEQVKAILHEYLGIIFYWVRGWV